MQEKNSFVQQVSPPHRSFDPSAPVASKKIGCATCRQQGRRLPAPSRCLLIALPLQVQHCSRLLANGGV